MLGNPVAIMHKHLSDQAALAALATGGIFSPRIPVGKAPPCISFFARGGGSNPHIKEVVEVSFQFDCWANSDDTPAEDSFDIYLELFDQLQGLENTSVVVDAVTYRIMSVVEEVPGQQIQPVDPNDYHKTLGLFRAMIEV